MKEPGDINRNLTATTPLDKIADAVFEMLRPLAQEHERSLRAIVMLADGDRATIAHAGYGAGGDAEVIADLLYHLQTILKSAGKDMKVGYVGKDGEVQIL